MDLEAIRRRVAELSGQSVQMWKPGPGKYYVRVLPWKNAPDGQPFVERWFYYFVKPMVLAPHQFGKPDPINDFVKKLWSSGKPDDRELAKKMKAKMRAYAPIIVRDKEDAGPLVWGLGYHVHVKLLSYFINEEVGDITDPETGYDIEVNIVQLPGKQFPDTTVEARRKPSKLSNDPEKVKAWLDAVPNIDDMYKLQSPREIEDILKKWLEGDDTSAPADMSDGTSKGGKAKSDLDDIVNEVSKPSKPKPDGAPSEEETPKTSIDDAFAELLGNGD